MATISAPAFASSQDNLAKLLTFISYTTTDPALLVTYDDAAPLPCSLGRTSSNAIPRGLRQGAMKPPGWPASMRAGTAATESPAVAAARVCVQGKAEALRKEAGNLSGLNASAARDGLGLVE